MHIAGVGEQHRCCDTSPSCNVCADGDAAKQRVWLAGVGEQHMGAVTHRHQAIMFVQTVMLLSEECGLLEWVNNTQGLRHIVTRLFIQVFA